MILDIIFDGRKVEVITLKEHTSPAALVHPDFIRGKRPVTPEELSVLASENNLLCTSRYFGAIGNTAKASVFYCRRDTQGIVICSSPCDLLPKGAFVLFIDCNDT